MAVEKLRHQVVSVGVLYDPEAGFLLFENPQWDGYAFCMKKPPAGVDLAEAALIALEEDSPLRFPSASARPLDVVGAYGPSGSSGIETYYEYHVFELDAGEDRGGPAADPRAKFFTYERLVESPEVTWSTREIARALIERQEVAAAVVTRAGDTGPEFLLTYHPAYGYFLPSARRKTGAPAEDTAEQAVRWDVAYDGKLESAWERDVADVHASARLAAGDRRFMFQLCTVKLPDNDEAAIQAFDKAVQAASAARSGPGEGAAFADWFTLEQMRGGPDMSPTLTSLIEELERLAR